MRKGGSAKSNAGTTAAAAAAAAAPKPSAKPPAVATPTKPSAASASASASASKPQATAAPSYDDEDEWGDSVSSPPKKLAKGEGEKKQTSTVVDDDEGWDDAPAGGGDSAANDNDGWDDDDDAADVKTSASASSSSSASSGLALVKTISKTESGAGASSSDSKRDYLVLEPADLAARQDALVKQVSELLFVSPADAACLLRNYGWKSPKLQSDWLTDQKKVRATAGLSEATTAGAANAKPKQCASALCDDPPAYALNCGHWFCESCWAGYLTSQVTHGRSCIFTTCMGMRCTLNHAHKFGCACKEIVPEAVVRQYVADKALLVKYDRWLMESFVEGQRSIKWCPNGKCGNAVEYKAGGMKSIACKCGHRFCFSCSQEAHTPAPCDLVKKWLEKSNSDEATEIWLAARTKQCPKCQVRIEKNKACNHMSCSKCSYQFCWLCKGPWDKHGSQTGGYYVCNKYNEDAKTGQVTSEEQSILVNQKLLQKYEYYFKRFRSSADAIAFTLAIHKRIEAKTQAMELSRFSFLSEAVDKLVDARRVLEWSYCLAYYLREGKQKSLFEYQQQMLVGRTEELQDVMDNTTDIEKLLALHDSIVNRTRTMDRFRHEMVAQIERGDFEELLLAKADASLGSVWTCSNCKCDNKKEHDLCSGCTACQKHGEVECKACAKRT